MAKVPPVPYPSVQVGDQAQEAIPVLEVEVSPAQDHFPSLVLSLAVQDAEFQRGGRERKRHFALSLPAATQLSDLLKEAVKEYLRASPPDTPDQSPENPK